MPSDRLPYAADAER